MYVYDVVAMDLPIRVKHPDVLPFVGMFSDPLDVAKAVKPLTMQLEQEKIEEDAEEANVTKDADFYRQKAKRRRIFYSNKSVMKFEDTQSSRTEDGPPVGVQFEGVPWAPSTTSLTGEVKPMENRAVHIKGEDQAHAMNQYALLKVVKRVNNTTGKTDTEVDMIPLGGFYKFRKPAINRGQTLELVDDEFEEELARRKKSHAKYQAFVFKQPDEDDEEAAAVAATISRSSAATSSTLPQRTLLCILSVVASSTGILGLPVTCNRPRTLRSTALRATQPEGMGLYCVTHRD